MENCKSTINCTLSSLITKYLNALFRYSSQLLSKGVLRTNIMYGELKIKESRVVYVQGSIDPWHVLGITKTNIANTVAIYINGRYIL